MPKRLSEILRTARRQFFVGREKELQLFRSILEQPELNTYILSVYGPGGQGKSTLVNAFTDYCSGQGISYTVIDARELNPTPDSFTAALQNSLGNPEKIFDYLQNIKGKFVLLVDTYELLTALDDWMRKEFIPQMPDNVLTVIAGRKPPSSGWTSDAGWQTLMKTIQLRNLTPAESRRYLQKRNIPAPELEKVLDFTHGHPLALCVVADLFDQQPGRSFTPESAPDVVRTLLERFVQKAPSPAHRIALEICAIAKITTESLLQQTMELQDASELFEWLQDLSFIESSGQGLFPHDSAREALCTDLAWRNPDWNKDLHKRIRKYYVNKIDAAGAEEKRNLLYLLAYLHRNHPMVKPYLEWQGSIYWIEKMKEADVPAINEMVIKNEGNLSAANFNFWVNHPASTCWVYKSSTVAVDGFMLCLNMSKLQEGEKTTDEVFEKLKLYASKNAGLRKGETGLVFRFWMAAETYQQVSRLQSSIFLTLTQHYFMPGLAMHFLCCANPSFWQSFLSFADMQYIPELDYETGGKSFGIFMHDWRKTAPAAWLELVGQRDAGEKTQPLADAPQMQMMILSEDEFAASVYEALKEYQSDKKLAANPLIRSKLVMGNADGHTDIQILLAALKDCIAEACDSIKDSPKEEKFFRVIFRTFINPVGPQEAVADYLNIPFSTYRRYLRKAVNMVTAHMWTRELER